MSSLIQKLTNIKTEKDNYIIPDNIKSGVSVFGVEGSSTVLDTGRGDAVSDDIAEGKVAYADGEELTGNIPVKN